MSDFLNKKDFKPAIVVLIISAFLIGLLTGNVTAPKTSIATSPDLSEPALYAAAVKDAITVEPEEILPLVEITDDSDMVTWNDAHDKILLISWHKYPDSYKAGEEVNLKWGVVWTFTDKEICNWCQKNGSDVADWNLRLEQLIGLPPECGYTHFSAFWASPEDVIRPAYVTDIAADDMQTVFPDNISSEYTDWFANNIMESYFVGEYPWTRLGYTYDWERDENEYGLSEFIIRQGADVEVEFTKTNDEFVDWLQ